MAITRWLVSCQTLCQQLFLPTLAFKATDCCKLLEDAIALLLATAPYAAPDGRGHLRHNIGNALDALGCRRIDCLDAFRPARPTKF
eukprot:363658-Chlamydomonas_euryale.AAC.2